MGVRLSDGCRSKRISIAVENVRLVVLDVAKDAVPVGTAVLGFQFVAVSKSLVAGLASHVASTARAAVLEGATPMARTPTYNTRRARMLLRSRPLVFNPSIKTPSERSRFACGAKLHSARGGAEMKSRESDACAARFSRVVAI